MAHDSQSAPSEGFIMVDPVEDSSYSRSRSPQRNADNLSSAQVAGASSDRNDVNVSSYTHAGYNDPRYTIGLVHQPISTGYTTETGGTDDTQIKFDTIAAHDQGLTGVSATPGMYFGHVSDNSLTLSNMDRLQYHLYPGDIHTWIDNAGLGRRLNRHLTSKRGSKSASSSRSKLSTTSSADQDWAFVPQPYAMDNEVAFAGEWSGEQLDQLHHAVGHGKSKGE